MFVSDADSTLAQLKELVARFRDEREWSQFHNPKDLAVSISIEAGELLELFQWQSREQVEHGCARIGALQVSGPSFTAPFSSRSLRIMFFLFLTSSSSG